MFQPGDSPCSCVDCESSCPASAAPPERTYITDWKIGTLFGMFFVMIMVFTAGSVVISGGALLAWRLERNARAHKDG